MTATTDRTEGDDGFEDAGGVPSGTGSAADDRDGTGVSWDSLEIIARGPKRLIPNALLLMVELRRMDGMRATLQQVAKRLKVTETVIADCAAHAPQLLDLSRDGRRIRLRTEPPPPWVVDPAKAKEVERQVEAERKARERREAQAERDALDTPFNRLRASIEALGMIRDDARGFAGFLLRTYNGAQIEEAIRIAAENRPGEPKGYVIRLLKNGVSPRTPAEGMRGGARSVPRTARPDGSGRTSLIGWEDRLEGGVRHKLYRLPDGSLRKERPVHGEAIPTIAEDPGFRVAA